MSRIQFYGTDGSIEKRPPIGGSVPHKLHEVKELGDVVELAFRVANPQHLKPGDPEEKRLQIPIEHYANMQLPETDHYDLFRSVKTKCCAPTIRGSPQQQSQEIKFYVGLDIHR